MSKEDFDKAKQEIKRQMKTYLIREFFEKHLSGNLMFNGIKITTNTFKIAPKKYDTAWYISTSRKKTFGGIGVGAIRFTGGSYASELNKKGSEFEVFKKKDKSNKKSISQLPTNQLERVKVYPHNHKLYANRALFFAVSNVARKYKGEIVKWRVRN